MKKNYYIKFLYLMMSSIIFLSNITRVPTYADEYSNHVFASKEVTDPPIGLIREVKYWSNKTEYLRDHPDPNKPDKLYLNNYFSRTKLMELLLNIHRPFYTFTFENNENWLGTNAKYLNIDDALQLIDNTEAVNGAYFYIKKFVEFLRPQRYMPYNYQSGLTRILIAKHFMEANYITHNANGREIIIHPKDKELVDMYYDYKKASSGYYAPYINRRSRWKNEGDRYTCLLEIKAEDDEEWSIEDEENNLIFNPSKGVGNKLVKVVSSKKIGKKWKPNLIHETYFDPEAVDFYQNKIDNRIGVSYLTRVYTSSPEYRDKKIKLIHTLGFSKPKKLIKFQIILPGIPRVNEGAILEIKKDNKPLYLTKIDNGILVREDKGLEKIKVYGDFLLKNLSKGKYKIIISDEDYPNSYVEKDITVVSDETRNNTKIDVTKIMGGVFGENSTATDYMKDEDRDNLESLNSWTLEDKDTDYLEETEFLENNVEVEDDEYNVDDREISKIINFLTKLKSNIENEKTSFLEKNNIDSNIKNQLSEEINTLLSLITEAISSENKQLNDLKRIKENIKDKYNDIKLRMDVAETDEEINENRESIENNKKILKIKNYLKTIKNEANNFKNKILSDTNLNDENKDKFIEEINTVISDLNSAVNNSTIDINALNSEKENLANNLYNLINRIELELDKAENSNIDRRNEIEKNNRSKNKIKNNIKRFKSNLENFINDILGKEDIDSSLKNNFVEEGNNILNEIDKSINDEENLDISKLTELKENLKLTIENFKDKVFNKLDEYKENKKKLKREEDEKTKKINKFREELNKSIKNLDNISEKIAKDKKLTDNEKNTLNNEIENILNNINLNMEADLNELNLKEISDDIKDKIYKVKDKFNILVEEAEEKEKIENRENAENNRKERKIKEKVKKAQKEINKIKDKIINNEDLDENEKINLIADLDNLLSNIDKTKSNENISLVDLDNTINNVISKKEELEDKFSELKDLAEERKEKVRRKNKNITLLKEKIKKTTDEAKKIRDNIIANENINEIDKEKYLKNLDDFLKKIDTSYIDNENADFLKLNQLIKESNKELADLSDEIEENVETVKNNNLENSIKEEKTKKELRNIDKELKIIKDKVKESQLSAEDKDKILKEIDNIVLNVENLNLDNFDFEEIEKTAQVLKNKVKGLKLELTDKINDEEFKNFSIDDKKMDEIKIILNNDIHPILKEEKEKIKKLTLKDKKFLYDKVNEIEKYLTDIETERNPEVLKDKLKIVKNKLEKLDKAITDSEKTNKNIKYKKIEDDIKNQKDKWNKQLDKLKNELISNDLLDLEEKNNILESIYKWREKVIASYPKLDEWENNKNKLENELTDILNQVKPKSRNELLSIHNLNETKKNKEIVNDTKSNKDIFVDKDKKLKNTNKKEDKLLKKIKELDPLPDTGLNKRKIKLKSLVIIVLSILSIMITILSILKKKKSIA